MPNPVQVVAGRVEDAVAAIWSFGIVWPRIVVAAAGETAGEEDEVGLRDDLAQPLGDRRVLEPPAAHQLQPRLVDRLLEAARFVEGHRQRLLGVDVLAGGKGFDGQGRMRVVSRAQQHGLDGVVVEDTLPVGRVVRGVDLLGAPLGRRLDDIHCGDQAHFRCVADIGQVSAADAAAADEGRVQLVCHRCSPLSPDAQSETRLMSCFNWA